MIPATVSASYAFMIPVATPPNAIAFSYGYLKVYDMVRLLLGCSFTLHTELTSAFLQVLTGVLMNAICVGVVVITLNTIGTAVFGLTSFPSDVLGNCTVYNVSSF